MANEFININDIIADINSVMVENTDGNITAAAMKAFLIDLANRLGITRQHLSFITGLTGGSPADLDALDTENIDAGTIITVSIGGRFYEYELVTGTGEEIELSPFLIKPDDYHNKYWRRTDVIFGTFTNEELADYKLTINHNGKTLYTRLWLYDNDNAIVHGKQWYPGGDLEMSTEVDLVSEITGTYKYVLGW